MSQVILDGKTYITSKRAASEFGYTQDYVGQLCRGGHIEAKRVSNQWYVLPESLQSYKDKAEAFKPEPPKYQPDPNADATLKEDGKEFVSASLAAKITQYNQDYVGQLARAGKVPSKQIGNRWYIDKDAILAHKLEKDALLRAVQAESVGLKRPENKELAQFVPHTPFKSVQQDLMVYSKEDRPLFPEMKSSINESSTMTVATNFPVPAIPSPSSRIPIRVVSTRSVMVNNRVATVATTSSRDAGTSRPSRAPVSLSGKSIFLATLPATSLAVLILIAGGIGVFYRSQIVAFISPNSTNLSASVAASNPVFSSINALLTKEIVYERSQ